MTRFARLGAACAVATLLAVGVATPAQAADDNVGVNVEEYIHVLDTQAGFGGFYHVGDKFLVCRTNDWIVYLEYEYIRKDGTLQRGTHTMESTGCRYFPHDFGEGRYVEMRVCADVDNWWDACTAWRQGVV